jgi:hypothetical protein
LFQRTPKIGVTLDSVFVSGMRTFDNETQILGGEPLQLRAVGDFETQLLELVYTDYVEIYFRLVLSRLCRSRAPGTVRVRQ